MLVKCNLPGGFRLRKLHLRHGPNDICPNEWRETLESLDPRFVKGMLEPVGSARALIEISNAGPAVQTPLAPSTQKEKPALTLESELTHEQMHVREKLVAVRACKSLEELKRLGQGEKRKTVLDLIAKVQARIQKAG